MLGLRAQSMGLRATPLAEEVEAMLEETAPDLMHERIDMVMMRIDEDAYKIMRTVEIQCSMTRRAVVMCELAFAVSLASCVAMCAFMLHSAGVLRCRSRRICKAGGRS